MQNKRTVRDLPYRRVTAEEMKEAAEKFRAVSAAAKNVRDVLAAREEYLSAFKEFVTMDSLSNSRYTLDTRDPFWRTEKEYYNAAGPVVSLEHSACLKTMLESPFRTELEDRLGSLLFRKFEVAVKAHSERTVEDEREENELVTRYSTLLSELLFDWKGGESSAFHRAGRTRSDGCGDAQGGGGRDRQRTCGAQGRTRRIVRRSCQSARSHRKEGGI